MTAVCQVVSAVGTGGTLLLDLNRHLAGVMLGPRGDVQLAEVERAQQSGDQPFSWPVAPSEPGQLRTRTITVPLVLFAATADATAALVAQLMKLTAGPFILRVQRHGSTVPVWLRCAGAAPQLDTNVVGAGRGTTLVTGTLTAETEAHALGARVDVAAVTVTQDPATGTPFVLDVNSVAGDSLTPLVLRTSDADVRGQVDGIYVSTRRRGVPSALAGLVVQGEAASTALGATPPTLATFTGDSTFSGSSGLRATYALGASGPWTATAAFSSLTGVEAPGMYHLFVRVRRTGGAVGQLFSLIGTAGPKRLVETVAAGGNDVRIVDLGLVQVPFGQPPFMASPESPVRAAAPSISVSVVRAAEGTGTFEIDWIGLFPADQDAGKLEVSTAIASGVLVLDGWDHTPRMFTTDPFTGVTPAAQGATGLSWVGGAPRVGPGNNRLYIVAGLGIATASARTPALAMDISASYWPRYQWLG